MTNIILTEKEIKILLMNSLKQAGIELENIVFKQKVQLFGKDRGVEINAELVKKQEADEVSALLNKLTYQSTNQFIPAQAAAVEAVNLQSPQPAFKPAFQAQSQPKQHHEPEQSYTFGQPFIAE